MCYRKDGVLMRVSSAGRLLPWVGGGLGSRSKQTERGYTLQTLIITAVLVLVAVGAALVLVAINRSSSDDFEEAGNIGIDGKCQTWEIHLATLEAAGHGGPEGHGGVFSSNIGCLATCYWEITNWVNTGYLEYPGAYSVRNKLLLDDNGIIHKSGAHPHVSKLHYYDDNRAPAENYIRLGVVSLRVPAGAPEPSGGFSDGVTDHRLYTNRPGWATALGDGDGKISLHVADADTNNLIPRNGARSQPGRPLTQAMIDAGIPTIAEPNWMSFGDNPGAGVLATDYPDTVVPKEDHARLSWEDEYWEVRADPGREVCEIVNVAHDDLLVCSSAAKDNLCETIISPLVIIPIPIG